MSIIDEKSPKHCGSKQQQQNGNHHLKKIKNNFSSSKKLICTFSTFFTSILFIIILIWFLLRPTKPQFSLKDTQITQLSSGAGLLNSSLQLTLLSQNPNNKIGIYYDDFLLYATYKTQQITVQTPLPPFYQEHEEKNLLSATLIGVGVPVAPSLGYEVGRDRSSGKLVVNVKGIGRLRWKVGTWVSGSYRFVVNCVSVMDFGPVVPSGPLMSKQGSHCSTTI
ncbi:NDR1/HIN1-like protein 26 [Impatiens glandulifera]|uniref:NDR1/HIN1-like protein 26 n=1 Tax=Impatiens glandulifera TaxID=253017 RepID=UPI001FB14AD2|nr:NDR1/HIN1-like protein 26 [Impatiens glandulifera]